MLHLCVEANVLQCSLESVVLQCSVESAVLQLCLESNVLTALTDIYVSVFDWNLLCYSVQ